MLVSNGKRDMPSKFGCNIFVRHAHRDVYRYIYIYIPLRGLIPAIKGVISSLLTSRSLENRHVHQEIHLQMVHVR